MEQPFLEYSPELDQLNGKAIEQDLGLTVKSIKRIEMGEVSYVYKVNTKEKGNLLTKIFKISEFVPPVGKFEWIEGQLEKNEVPVAKTILITRDSGYFPYGYMVQEFIEGKSGFDAIMDGDIPFEEFFNQLVVILQKIHDISPDRFGEFPEWAGKPKPLSEVEITAYQRNFERLSPLKDIDPSVHEIVLAQVQKLKEYDGLFKPCLIHGDPGSSNTIITNEGIVIIDWDNAKIGTWVEEYAGMTFRGAFMHQYKTDKERNKMIERSFRNHYTGVNFDDPDLKEVVRILHILHAYGSQAVHYFQHQDMELYEVAKKRLAKLLVVPHFVSGG